MWLLVLIILWLLSQLVGHEGKEAVKYLLMFSHMYSFPFKSLHTSCNHFPLCICPPLTISPSNPHHSNHFLALWQACISISRTSISPDTCTPHYCIIKPHHFTFQISWILHSLTFLKPNNRQLSHAQFFFWLSRHLVPASFKRILLVQPSRIWRLLMHTNE